jgi:hypothetical protein
MAKVATKMTTVKMKRMMSTAMRRKMRRSSTMRPPLA